MFNFTGSLTGVCKQSLRVGNHLRIFSITNDNIKIFILGKGLTSQFKWSQRLIHSITNITHTVDRSQYTTNWDRLSRFKSYRGFRLWLGLTTGLGVGSLFGYEFINQFLIYNESALITTNDNMKLRMKENEYQADGAVISADESRKRRKIIYKQMCLGSILGIGFGLFIIKISSALIYLTVFSILALEWLRNRGIIDFRGNQLIQLGTSQSKSVLKRLKIQEMNIFKLTFLSTLLLTYVNY